MFGLPTKPTWMATTTLSGDQSVPVIHVNTCAPDLRVAVDDLVDRAKKIQSRPDKYIRVTGKTTAGDCRHTIVSTRINGILIQIGWDRGKFTGTDGEARSELYDRARRKMAEREPRPTPTERLRDQLHKERTLKAEITQTRKTLDELQQSHAADGLATMTDDQLKALLIDVSHMLRTKAGEIIFKEIVTKTLLHIGIDGPRYRRSRFFSLKQSGAKTFRQQLEWYAGEIVDMIQTNQLLAMNTWLNCVDVFTSKRGHLRTPYGIASYAYEFIRGIRGVGSGLD
ncbi:MAG: hypothetical protein ACD_62C00086G0002 [uncultured bacterium]|nr:MAG: hypothetical protein ACD_62C00086G0002 [uncultured bacterium]